MVAGILAVTSSLFNNYLLPQIFVLLSLVELVWILSMGRMTIDPRGWLVGLGFLAILFTGGALEQERQAQAGARERLVLERDLELKRRELEAARELQLSMLPKAPSQLNDLALTVGMRTASEVGGDYYDIRHDLARLRWNPVEATLHGIDDAALLPTLLLRNPENR